MSDVIIQVEGLGKRYRIGGARLPYRTIRETLREAALSPLRRLGRRENGPPAEEQFWALKEVSFQVRAGEVVGIIGRNGAGKSTLLKVLARVAEPTLGRARLRGRVGSLLEVGTGFHPELTGRENVYLSGTILGMRKAEIDRRFDAIVSFAEVEKFLDTPVKRYSSGMYVRLAFAVAAHLEPEILLVDEVLAVGDVNFQKKCLGKMADVSREGRTVLLVSHNMSAIQRLCQRCLVLHQGGVLFSGTAREAVATYMALGTEHAAERVWSEAERAIIQRDFLPLRACVRNRAGEVTDYVLCTEPAVVEFDYLVAREIANLRVGVMLFTSQGEWVFLSYDKDDPRTYEYAATPPGRYRSHCHLPANLLNEGGYVVGLYGGTGVEGRIWEDLHALSFTTQIGDGVGSHWPSTQERAGPIRPLLAWEGSRLGDA